MIRTRHMLAWGLAVALSACATTGLREEAMVPPQKAPKNVLPLWESKPPGPDPAPNDFLPTLETYLLPGAEPRGAVVVCPGGGYGGRAGHEAEPIARRFNEAGFHGFVVQYRVSPHRHPAPLMDASRAIRTIRAHAAEWKVDPAKIAILGFSAGGHLAATVGTHFDAGRPDAKDPIERQSSRPDALVLCYAVVSFIDFGHRGSGANLLGPKATQEQLRSMSLQRKVTKETPPTFLWHTSDDPVVPVENSLAFARALDEQNVPFELHVYPKGRHGLGLSPNDPHVATWAELCCEWLRTLGW